MSVHEHTGDIHSQCYLKKKKKNHLKQQQLRESPCLLQSDGKNFGLHSLQAHSGLLNLLA